MAPRLKKGEYIIYTRDTASSNPTNTIDGTSPLLTSDDENGPNPQISREFSTSQELEINEVDSETNHSNLINEIDENCSTQQDSQIQENVPNQQTSKESSTSQELEINEVDSETNHPNLITKIEENHPFQQNSQVEENGPNQQISRESSIFSKKSFMSLASSTNNHAVQHYALEKTVKLHREQVLNNFFHSNNSNVSREFTSSSIHRIRNSKSESSSYDSFNKEEK